MLKKISILLIGLLITISSFATNSVVIKSEPDKLILSLCQNLPKNFISKIDANLWKSLKSDPMKCANFIYEFVNSYRMSPANKVSGCKLAIKFPMRGQDMIICGQEL